MNLTIGHVSTARPWRQRDNEPRPRQCERLPQLGDTLRVVVEKLTCFLHPETLGIVTMFGLFVPKEASETNKQHSK